MRIPVAVSLALALVAPPGAAQAKKNQSEDSVKIHTKADKS